MRGSIKVILLITGIYFIAYTASMPGIQLWPGIVGAIAIGLYCSFE